MLIYTLIAFVLIIIICFVYYLIKPKVYDLNETYEKYLISTTNPKLAFTKAKIDGKYQNYYFDVSTEGVIQLNPTLDDLPVNGDGTSYIVKDHGTITAVDEKGYYLTGIETKFTCPEHWLWNDDVKVCQLEPICNENETATYKGITKYQFDNYNISSKEEAFHDRVYAHCLQNNVEFKSCTGNTIYNKVASQPDNINPCIDFDICSEYRDYTKHTETVNNYQLQDDEYYVCILKKSVLTKCEENLVFNPVLLICEPVNICTGKVNGTTSQIDDTSYNYCIDETPRKITCNNNIFISPDNVCSCRIEISETYISYFKNQIAKYPIELVVYDFNSNTKSHIIAPKVITQLEIFLEPLKSTSPINMERNIVFFEPISFQTHFVEYTNTDFTNSITTLVDYNTIIPYIYQKYVMASFHLKCTATFGWNVVLNEPNYNASFAFYKFNNDVYQRSNREIIGKSIDYIPFISTEKLYQPTTNVESLADEELGWTIMYTATFEGNMYFGVPVDYILAAYNSYETTLYLFLNHLTAEFTIIEFKNLVIAGTEYCTYDNSDFSVKSKYFNIPTLSTQTDKSYVQFSSILWFNEMDETENIIRPQFLLPILFRMYSELDNKFNILYKYKASSAKYMKQFNDFASIYTPSTTFNGDSSIFFNISSDLKSKYLK